MKNRKNVTSKDKTLIQICVYVREEYKERKRENKLSVVRVKVTTTENS